LDTRARAFKRIRAVFRLSSGCIQAVFRLYSGFIQVVFRLYSGACPASAEINMRIILPELELHNTCYGKMPADILEALLQRGRDVRDPCLPSSARRSCATAACPRSAAIVRGVATFSC